MSEDGSALDRDDVLRHDAAVAAGFDPSLERRSLELKGKQISTDVISLRVGASEANVT